MFSFQNQTGIIFAYTLLFTLQGSFEVWVYVIINTFIRVYGFSNITNLTITFHDPRLKRKRSWSLDMSESFISQ